MENDFVLSIRIPLAWNSELIDKFPDTGMRVLILRALVRKLIDGKIKVKTHEVYE